MTGDCTTEIAIINSLYRPVCSNSAEEAGEALSRSAFAILLSSLLVGSPYVRPPGALRTPMWNRLNGRFPRSWSKTVRRAKIAENNPTVRNFNSRSYVDGFVGRGVSFLCGHLLQSVRTTRIVLLRTGVIFFFGYRPSRFLLVGSSVSIKR